MDGCGDFAEGLIFSDEEIGFVKLFLAEISVDKNWPPPWETISPHGGVHLSPFTHFLAVLSDEQDQKPPEEEPNLVNDPRDELKNVNTVENKIQYTPHEEFYSS